MAKRQGEFLNEKKSDDIGGAWEQAIAGYENAIVLICDHPGSKMLKEMKGELEKRKLEGFAKDNKVIIMPKEEGNSSFLKKFKKDFLGE